MKSVFLLALLFALTSTSSFAQKKLIPIENLIVGIGYGKLLDGWGDIPGKHFYISAQAPLKQSRFFTVASKVRWN
ncbi:hypothetical protein R9C00_22630 [Flammeovirgaceae bacterium SG7u.111]|nr:hypothetical protein [Flammeovirgaceae bacterium SG7u.132]WPO34500.1 hypothetical protein R9C00_22630 [Flammeovirgaceae bacterium SG7u.111]